MKKDDKESEDLEATAISLTEQLKGLDEKIAHITQQRARINKELRSVTNKIVTKKLRGE